MAKPPTKSTAGGPGPRGTHANLKTARGRSNASQRWLSRQINDPYVKAAQAAGYRSRAAFKLTELNERFKLLKPGQRVVDLGAAPGGWTQVVLRALDERGQVVALDLLPMDNLSGAIVLQGDFQDDAAEAAVLTALGGQADLVLSDMAPNTTGHGPTDHLRIMDLAALALDFAEKVLAPGGSFVAKVFQGGSEKAMLERLRLNFARVLHAKPPASRKESSELYVVAIGFGKQ
ncbi:MAG: RlmE family methyltransferase [Rubritepida sp.]|nr:RlmE family methyltransferase [Rubritepida sp.]